MKTPNSVSPELGAGHAAGIPLKIAAKVDKVDEEYFRNEILPLIDGPGVEFHRGKSTNVRKTFLGEAAALLFPVDWPEPFGLVMLRQGRSQVCGLRWRLISVR
jgi:hypothetical protein